MKACDKSIRAAARLHGRVAREQEEQRDDDHSEHRQRAQLTAEERRGALLHGPGDVLHARRALVGRQHLAREDRGEGEGREREHRDDDDDGDARGTETEHEPSPAQRAARDREGRGLRCPRKAAV